MLTDAVVIQLGFALFSVLHLTCSRIAGALPPEVAARHPDVALIVDEVRIVQHARQHRSVVYLMGRTHARLTDGGLLDLPRRYLLEMPFKVQLLLHCNPLVHPRVMT